MKFANTQEKFNAAFDLLSGSTISLDTFHQVHSLVKGIHPRVDEKLEVVSKALKDLQKVMDGDVITLSAEHLSEKTEREKKRKKKLLFFIYSVKDLSAEIKRVETELSQANSQMGNDAWHFGKILKYAKGPFGLVTIIAVVIVVATLFVSKKGVQNTVIKPTVTPSGKQIQVITYQGHLIPVNAFFVGNGPDCDSPHYHAPQETTVTALDGTILSDPGGCGFGKVKDMQITIVLQ